MARLKPAQLRRRLQVITAQRDRYERDRQRLIDFAAAGMAHAASVLEQVEALNSWIGRGSELAVELASDLPPPADRQDDSPD